MEYNQDFSGVTSVIGDATRVLMLWNLLDGRAYTAGELALLAEVSPQSASMHLNKLVEGNFLSVEKQGRHRYYKISRNEVAAAIESLGSLVHRAPEGKHIKNGDIKFARTCYDHLAGKVAVDLNNALLAKQIIVKKEKTYVLTSKGQDWFNAIDVDAASLKEQRRKFARPCLDWSERRDHLAGSLGAALLQKLFEKDWIRRKKDSRCVIVTPEGERMLYDLLKIHV